MPSKQTVLAVLLATSAIAAPLDTAVTQSAATEIAVPTTTAAAAADDTSVAQVGESEPETADETVEKRGCSTYHGYYCYSQACSVM